MKKIIAAGLLLLAPVACSDAAPPAPTSTAIPTLVATVTKIPSPFPSTETPKPLPSPAWNGIPILPGAIAGEGDEEGYVFTVHATAAQVQDYYQLELEKLGWQFIGQENSGVSMILTFTNHASETLTVSIISKGDQALVLLVK